MVILRTNCSSNNRISSHNNADESGMVPVSLCMDTLIKKKKIRSPDEADGSFLSSVEAFTCTKNVNHKYWADDKFMRT